jgi:orotidine-5'-phosphate decarboxylase
MKNPIIVALDVDDLKKAEKLVEELLPVVGGFKIGPRLTFNAPKEFLRKISKSSVLFFDHKFFDIPSTTVASVRMAAEMGAHWVTVHALNGPVCLKQLGDLEKEIQKDRKEFKVLVVTVLTSFSQKDLPPIWIQEPIEKSVLKLAESAHDVGLKSFVCSPEEISALRTSLPDSFLVVPGLRPQGSSSGDQKRTATPAAALEAGASALVIGRPIVEHVRPFDAAKEILGSLH